jgi:hypothetical protein
MTMKEEIIKAIVDVLMQNRWENSEENGLAIEPLIFDSQFNHVAEDIFNKIIEPDLYTAKELNYAYSMALLNIDGDGCLIDNADMDFLEVVKIIHDNRLDDTNN